jgi:hypothetical protein
MIVTATGQLMIQLWGWPDFVDDFTVGNKAVPGQLCTAAAAMSMAQRIAQATAMLQTGPNMSIPAATIPCQIQGWNLDVENGNVPADWYRVDGGPLLNCWVLSLIIAVANQIITPSFELANYIDRQTNPDADQDRPIIVPNGSIGGPNFWLTLTQNPGMLPEVGGTWQGKPAKSVIPPSTGPGSPIMGGLPVG